MFTKKRIWAGLIAAVGLGAGVFASAVLATPHAGLTTTTVAEAPFPPIRIHSTDWAGLASQPPAFWAAKLHTIGVSDVYVVDNVLAPGGTTGWHTHPVPA